MPAKTTVTRHAIGRMTSAASNTRDATTATIATTTSSGCAPSVLDLQHQAGGEKHHRVGDERDRAPKRIDVVAAIHDRRDARERA